MICTQAMRCRKVSLFIICFLGSLVANAASRLDSLAERLRLFDGQMTTDYCDNVIYKDGALDRILMDEGYITLAANSSPVYHYFLRDHLGSVHVVLNGSGTVEETTHYYPYGAIFPQTPSQPYKFCGKELDRMHGLDWYDSQARMYDPVLTRWHTQDSKAENYYSWSPYAYCMGNPVNAIDPDGNSVWTKIAKASVKIGKQVVKHGAKALTEGATYAQAVADITDDINTLTDSEASTGSKVWAAISLASEALPLSINDVKDVKQLLNTSKHGNSRLSKKAQHAYDIVDKNTKEVVKTGISGGKKRLKDGKSQRAESQVRKWNKEAGTDQYESVITHEEPSGKGARSKILHYEKEHADKLRQQGHLNDIRKHQRP